MQKHGGKAKNTVGFYCANVHTLSEAESTMKCSELLENLKPTWDALFENYRDLGNFQCQKIFVVPFTNDWRKLNA